MKFRSDVFSIGICGRCQLKKDYKMLKPDPNVPGLRVCDGCRDEFDPYRLPQRQLEKFILEFPRPDVPVNRTPLFVTETDDTYFAEQQNEDLFKP